MRDPKIFNKDKAADLLKEHGLDVGELKVWITKFGQLQRHARQRGREFTLTLSQYIKKAIKADLTSPHQIGIGSDQYCISRDGDTGGYTYRNCAFVTNAENLMQRWENGGNDAAAKKRKGRTKDTDPGVRSAAEKNSRSFIVYSPSGKKFKGTNLKEFARTHDLDPGHMFAVCRGDASHHKGWTGKYV
jgi:hypothetical protein